MEKKILLAGPWIGELGWELFCWQGYIRFHSKDYDEVKIISRPGHEFLYEDFCDEFIPFDPESFKTDAWKCHDHKPYKDLVSTIEHTKYINGQFDIGMRYYPTGVLDTKGIFYSEQEYVKYKSDSISESYDLIFHCRNKNTGADRNWSKNNWIELYNLLKDDYTIACIGNDESHHIEGTKDMRGIPLNELCSLFNNSKLIVGPSSGPMHFASLCGLKHLVWSRDHNIHRYERNWNPHKTEVVFYGDESWKPKVGSINKLIRETV